MNEKAVPPSRTPVSLRPITRDVAHMLDYLAEGIGKLQTAVISRRRAAILDELATIGYFVQQLAAKHGITPLMLEEHAMVEGWFRDADVKGVRREPRVATVVVDGSGPIGPLQL